MPWFPRLSRRHRTGRPRRDPAHRREPRPGARPGAPGEGLRGGRPRRDKRPCGRPGATAGRNATSAKGGLNHLGRNGKDPRPLHEALGKITAKLARIESEARDAEEQLAALDGIEVIEHDVRDALRSFGPVWKELFPKEKAKVARGLIQSVTYDSATDDVEIEFKPEAVALIEGGSR